MDAAVASFAEPLESLVAKARAGDRRALEAVLAHVAPTAFRFGMRMCKNEHDAEDVVQDTLMGVAQHIHEFEGRSSLSTWLFTLVRTACGRRHRGQKNAPMDSTALLENRADSAASPEEQTGGRELAGALTQALDELSDEHREVILLRDVEGLSAPEAAGVLGITVDALKSRLHRAREALREILRPTLEPHLAAPSTCPDVVRLWSQKLEGDLSQTDCSAMEDHMKGCASCTGACDALKRALLACKNVQSTAVPEAVQARVKRAMRALVDLDVPRRAP